MPEANLDDLIYAGADREEPQDPPVEEPPAEEPKPEEPPAEEPKPEEPPAEEPKPEEPPAEEPKPEEPHIPKSRFDEVNERRKIAEQKLREMEAKQQEVRSPDFDFKGKEKAYMDAVLDGDTEKALALRDEIRTAEQMLYQQMTEKAERTARTAAKEDIKLEQTINELTAQYAEFDPESDVYSEDVTKEVLSLQRTFLQDGYDRDKALRKAANYVAKVYDLSNRTATPDKPGLQAAAASPAPRATSEQIASKVELATKQPPSGPATGRDIPQSVDVMQMSEDEFEKLSPAELRKLRGDFRQ